METTIREVVLNFRYTLISFIEVVWPVESENVFHMISSLKFLLI